MFENVRKSLCDKYCSVASLLCDNYFRAVSFVTVRFVSFTFSMIHYLFTIKNNNLSQVESLATRFANMTANMLRQVIILRGEDPDYVAPPPPVVRKVYIGKDQPSWVRPSFTDIKKNPVFASRLKIEENKAEEAKREDELKVKNPIAEAVAKVIALTTEYPTVENVASPPVKSKPRPRRKAAPVKRNVRRVSKK